MNNQIQLVLKSSTTELSLNDHELGIYLTPELDGLTGLPEIRTTSGVNAGYDGGWTSAQNYDARSITIRGVIANENVATVEQLRRQLTTLAGQGKNEELTLDLVTQGGKAYTIQVRTIALEMALQKVLCQQEFMLQLRADDPLIYDGGSSGESVIVQVQKAIGGFQINFELPLAISGGSGESTINNGGLEQVYPIIKMYGALHNPTFVNQTTNQQFEVNATLGFAEGAWHTPSELYEGTTINIPDAPDNAPLASFQLDGETSQNGTPTPDAPVPVNTTTGENVVKITGKNLFDNSQSATLELGATASAISTGIRITKKSGAGSWSGCVFALFRASDYAGQVIRFSATATPSSTNSPYCAIIACDENGNNRQSLIAITDGQTDVKLATTIPSNLAANKYIGLTINASGATAGDAGAYTDYTNAMLTIGDSSYQDYEPYQGQSYEVNLGKNLFDKDHINNLHAWFLGGSATFQAYTAADVSVYIPAEPNTTYTASKTKGDRFSFGSSVLEPAGGVAITRAVANNNASSLTITTGPNDHYLAAFVRSINSQDSYEDVLATLQIEKGSQATPYAAYFTPIELCKIGDYQDYIYKSGDKWYVHQAIGKVIADGNKVWTKSQYGTNNYSFAKYGVRNVENKVMVISDQTKGVSYDDRASAGMICYYTQNQIFVRNIDISTAADLTTHCASTPMTFYYVLTTPTDTEITNEALIAQLEAVLAARTYAGTNNIITITPNEQGTLEISYMTEKDADKRDVMVIDSRMRTVTLNGADIYHLITAGSEFPMLAPGENKLLLRSDTPGDNGYADVNYKQGYLTI